MRKERTNIPVRVLELNTGQVDWLPKNPRTWTEDDVRRTEASIQEDPDFLDDRPLLVVPKGHKFIAFAGNLRLTACRKAGITDAPCIVYHPETDEDHVTVVRRAMKDNGSFGSWDYDTLANEWGDLPLTDWGVPVWEPEKEEETVPQVSLDQFGDDFQLPDGEKSDARQMSFVLTNAQVALVQAAIDLSRATLGELDGENQNENGAALFEIIKGWSRATLGELDGEAVATSLDAANIEVEGIRTYLRAALNESGRKARDVDELLGTNGMSGHYFGSSQWLLPTRSAYEKMKTILPLTRDYSELFSVVARQKYYAAIVALKDNLKDDPKDV